MTDVLQFQSQRVTVSDNNVMTDVMTDVMTAVLQFQSQRVTVSDNNVVLLSLPHDTQSLSSKLIVIVDHVYLQNVGVYAGHLCC